MRPCPKAVRSAGSSPLSRGILEQLAERNLSPRIIPALAGNTTMPHWNRSMTPDHPRSRGEYSRGRICVRGLGGSSPLSRGIPLKATTQPTPPGIIPALAGNTGVSTPNPFPIWDHPRSRGEYHLQEPQPHNRNGSSPLSRGILRWLIWDYYNDRIIPALAGNTNCCFNCTAIIRDHPRSRGEYKVSGLVTMEPLGSSPLSRGIHGNQCTYQVSERIIPALAGNTRTACRTQPQPPDHPRSRGEYYDAALESLYDAGSSPLSRGIPLKATTQPTPPGIIPALAGNTRFLDW